MMAMLREMVTESCAALDSGVDESKAISIETNKQVALKASDIVTANSAIYSSIQQHHKGVSKDISAFESKIDSQHGKLRQCVEFIKPQNAQLRLTVENIRSSVDISAKSIITSADDAVDHCNTALDSIASSSANLQQGISSNHSELLTAVEESTRSVEESLTSGHEANSSKLSAHATRLDDHFIQQSEGISAHLESAQKLNDALSPLCPVYGEGESVIGVPETKQYEHKVTREHETIKQEVRQKLQPLPLDAIVLQASSNGNNGKATSLAAVTIAIVPSVDVESARSPMMEIGKSNSSDYGTGFNNKSNKGLMPEASRKSQNKKNAAQGKRAKGFLSQSCESVSRDDLIFKYVPSESKDEAPDALPAVEEETVDENTVVAHNAPPSAVLML